MAAPPPPRSFILCRFRSKCLSPDAERHRHRMILAADSIGVCDDLRESLDVVNFPTANVHDRRYVGYQCSRPMAALAGR